MRENVVHSALRAAWPASAVEHCLADRRSRPQTSAQLGALLRELVGATLDQLPMPGDGETLERWRALAAVAAYDLSLAKLYEGHSDALTILYDLCGPVPAAQTTWGVWAAEGMGSRVRAVRTEPGRT
jgi:hypothetical protein